jgi:hypothetical protein
MFVDVYMLRTDLQLIQEMQVVAEELNRVLTDLEALNRREVHIVQRKGEYDDLIAQRRRMMK